ncbi:hypothetical protein [Rhodococcus sp. HNM0569]|uniref:hypothetical protein n=1 Tax=Rhodococcus sp. HNM0569 TaxID=2716340 RepID=UPI00146E9BF4|nr:hypothetical protein [Rhodococcus sp. HNM0569]NLU83611.1 hypothetical protein [Rhodococcus sp. HNM0569]
MVVRENSLEYERRSFINFRAFSFGEGSHHRNQWIDVKCFRMLDRELDDRSILAAMIGQVEFRDDYVGGGADPAGTRHGPYWLHSITPDQYRPTDGADTIQLLRRWTAPCGVLPDAFEDAIERAFRVLVRGAARVYTLAQLHGPWVHDYGDIHTEFHEIVVIGRKLGQVVLAVAADD